MVVTGVTAAASRREPLSRCFVGDAPHDAHHHYGPAALGGRLSICRRLATATLRTFSHSCHHGHVCYRSRPSSAYRVVLHAASTSYSPRYAAGRLKIFRRDRFASFRPVSPVAEHESASEASKSRRAFTRAISYGRERLRGLAALSTPAVVHDVARHERRRHLRRGRGDMPLTR